MQERQQAPVHKLAASARHMGWNTAEQPHPSKNFPSDASMHAASGPTSLSWNRSQALPTLLGASSSTPSASASCRSRPVSSAPALVSVEKRSAAWCVG